MYQELDIIYSVIDSNDLGDQLDNSTSDLQHSLFGTNVTFPNVVSNDNLVESPLPVVQIPEPFDITDRMNQGTSSPDQIEVMTDGQTVDPVVVNKGTDNTEDNNVEHNSQRAIKLVFKEPSPFRNFGYEGFYYDKD